MSKLVKKDDEMEIFNTKNVVTKLEKLMDRVTEDKATADTVNAACNCADKIVDILKFHLDLERLKIKKSGLNP